MRLPSARWLGAVAVVVCLVSVGWLGTHGSVVTTHGLYPQYGDLATALLGILGTGFGYLQNMIGDFGWLDAPVPPLTFVAWYLGLGALLLPCAAPRSGSGSRSGL